MPEKVNGNKFSSKSNIASLNSSSTSIDSKSAVQLNSTEHKLATLQKMADNSPYSKRFAHLTSLANNSIQKQPVSQLSMDIHSLPDNVKQGVESLSGISMDDVKVHYNSAKPAQLNAHAYAQGTDIHIASGQEKHLPHEAWHVVQQKQGRVRPTTMMKAKVPINDDQVLEKEADEMGARALQMKPISISDYKTEKLVQRKGIVQKVKKSAEDEWDAHINPKAREAFSDDKDVLDDVKSASEMKKKPRKRSLRESSPESDNEGFLDLRGKIDGDIDALSDAKSAAEEGKIQGNILETITENAEEEKSAEEEAKKERISALKLSKLKFNFAGSGESVWKTHREKNDKDGKRIEGFKDVEHMSGGKKMHKEKENKEELGTRKLIFEYAGPMDKILGVAKGAYDSGNNSTAKNLEDAQETLEDSLHKLRNFVNNDTFVIKMDIKGFSRGAATASTFAAWAKASKWGKNLDINLLLIDPVDGHKLSAEMDSEVDVSKVYDDKKPDTTGTTLMMPLKSGWESISTSFTPQKIKGYQRLIIITGSKAKHSFGLGEDKKSTLHWNGEEVKGMEITKLPKGFFTVNSEIQPLTIVQVTKKELTKWYKFKLLMQAKKGTLTEGEEREKVLARAWHTELSEYIK